MNDNPRMGPTFEGRGGRSSTTMVVVAFWWCCRLQWPSSHNSPNVWIRLYQYISPFLRSLPHVLGVVNKLVEVHPHSAAFTGIWRKSSERSLRLILRFSRTLLSSRNEKVPRLIRPKISCESSSKSDVSVAWILGRIIQMRHLLWHQSLLFLLLAY